MFVQGDPEAVQKQLHRLEERGSILDTLLDDTKQLSRSLGSDDRSRLDQYLTSVREVEERLLTAREWELKPKPARSSPSLPTFRTRSSSLKSSTSCSPWRSSLWSPTPRASSR
jgi:hypothetical protein